MSFMLGRGEGGAPTHSGMGISQIWYSTKGKIGLHFYLNNKREILSVPSGIRVFYGL